MKYYILCYKEDAKPPHSKGRKDKPLTFSATFIPVFLNRNDAEFENENSFDNEFYIKEINF